MKSELGHSECELHFFVNSNFYTEVKQNCLKLNVKTWNFEYHGLIVCRNLSNFPTLTANTYRVSCIFLQNISIRIRIVYRVFFFRIFYPTWICQCVRFSTVFLFNCSVTQPVLSFSPDEDDIVILWFLMDLMPCVMFLFFFSKFDLILH